MINYDDTTNESAEYAAFVEKFKPKKTTDDCYTPANVYDAVRDWAVAEYGLQGRTVLRPFYPGGDYLAEEYPADAVVIDNPPFSILSSICDFYDLMGIDYFMFAPSLTLFSTNAGRCNYVLSDSNITYANGANVRTAFVTNLGPHKILVTPELHEALARAEKENTAGRSLPKYTYPADVITPAVLQKLANHGVRVAFDAPELSFTRTLDSQRPFKKSVFGAGFILSENATQRHVDALHQAAENDLKKETAPEAGTVWTLSEREREIQRGLI